MYIWRPTDVSSLSLQYEPGHGVSVSTPLSQQTFPSKNAMKQNENQIQEHFCDLEIQKYSDIDSNNWPSFMSICGDLINKFEECKMFKQYVGSDIVSEMCATI